MPEMHLTVVGIWYPRKTTRFVRAAGAVKALRARTFGGEGAGARGAIGFAASRLAKSLVDKINGWDTDRDGKSEEAKICLGRGGRERENRANMCVCVRVDTLSNITNPRRCTV